ncbi:MAG: YdgA family protein [Sulfurovum sp.]|nr:YdgA family protein [Sulfurovum sp.]
MNLKKLGFWIFGIVLVLTIYYFTTSYSQTIKRSEQITKLKQQINAQLTQIQTNGFTISNREILKEKEHFIVSLDDPQKAVVFFAQKGIRMKVEEAEELKGLKLDTDVVYLNDTIAIEIYPIVLPINLKTLLIKENDKEILAQIDEMLKKKILFTHIDIDHSATTFKGYIKDINETVKGKKEIQVNLKGYQFSGNIKDERIIKFNQTLNTLRLYMSDIIDRYMSDLQSSYVLTGETAYDYTSEYTIGKMQINEDPEVTLLATDISLFSTSHVKNGLAVERLNTKIKNIDLLSDKNKFGMQTFFLDMNISNIDVYVLEKLQKTDSNKEKKFDTLEKTLSNTIHLEIPTLSVDKVTLKGKEMDGFTLHSILDIDPSLDIYSLGTNPKHALSKMDGNITLSLSKEILELIKEDPKAMLGYMMYRPKRVLGNKVYDLKLKDGLLNINGKDFKLNGKPVKF